MGRSTAHRGRGGLVGHTIQEDGRIGGNDELFALLDLPLAFLLELLFILGIGLSRAAQRVPADVLHEEYEEDDRPGEHDARAGDDAGYHGRFGAGAAGGSAGEGVGEAQTYRTDCEAAAAVAVEEDDVMTAMV